MVTDTVAILAPSLLFSLPLPTAALAVVLAIAVMAGGSLYLPRFTLSFWDDALRIAGAGLVGVGLAILSVALLSGGPLPGLAPMAAAVAGLVTVRALVYQVIRWARSRGIGRQRAVIVGGGMVASRLAASLSNDPKLGLDLVGFVEDRPMMPSHELGAPLLGSPDDLATVIANDTVGHVIVAFSSQSSADLVKLIRTCGRAHAEVSLVPRLFELSPVTGASDRIGGIPLLRLRRTPHRSGSWPLKRVFDLTVAGLTLVLLSPVMLFLALILRLTDGPGVIFRQRRVGLDGREFDLLKFRSMRPASESESQTLWNIKDDNRVTPLGRFLRRSSLDEIPQLLNVIKGEMSLVGPRPERPHFVEVFSDADGSYEDRHRVPAGLTGWAQIHGLRGDTSIVERARFDNYYIENWSLWLDVKIMALTATSFLRGAA